MIENLINSAIAEGYSLEHGSENQTIKTKRGDVKIYLHDDDGNPFCYPFGNEIHLHKNRKNLVRDLMHEKGHFDILPYDFLLYGILSLTPGIGAYLLHENSADWKYQISTLSAITLASFVLGLTGGVNLISDAIIGIRGKLKLNRAR